MLLINILKEIEHEIRNTGSLGLSMGFRLFLFLALLVVSLVLGIIVILLLTGTWAAGLRTSEKVLDSQLNFTSRNISQRYGQLSIEAVEFSKSLATSIEKHLEEKGLETTDLQKTPQVLETILAKEYERALFALQKSKSSGVFIILDATINPKIVNPSKSKTGIYIKNMEPNIISSSSPTFQLLRGFPDIGRNNSLPLHSQWSMEFDISNAPYYQVPMEQGDKEVLPLSRLYYWSPSIILPGTSEEVMLCSVPLIDSQGRFFGVCGLEISAMLFKLSYMPDYSNFIRNFCMLAPIYKDFLNTHGAMFAGGSSARSVFSNTQLLHIRENPKSFSLYTGEGGKSFLGFHKPIDLYPQDSPFIDQKWAVALLVPIEDVRDSIASYNIQLSLKFTLLIALGILISFFLSKSYIKPITKGLDLIKSKSYMEAPKTKIPEIDNIIEYLSTQNNILQEKGKEDLPPALTEFIENLKNLSPAERSVFNLYAQGHSAKEIAAILCLSINTIKTHSKRIYAKLNISSREELLVYINMLQEAGQGLQ